MFSSKLYLREDAVKNNNTAPIYLTIIIDRKVKKYHTECFVEPAFWDGNCVKSKYIRANEINLYINSMKNKAEKIAMDIMNDGKLLTFDVFEQYFLKNKGSIDFYAFCENFLITNGSRYAKSTLKRLYTELTKLKKFAPKLYFNQLNLDFLNEYEKYMRDVLHNKTNTIGKTMKTLKMYTNQAFISEVIKEVPFKDYKIRKVPSNKIFLSDGQLNTLEDLYLSKQLDEKLTNTLKVFLFSCYTGLRYSDVLLISKSNIIDDKYINLVNQKTNEQVIIPLIDKANELIDNSINSGNLFRVYSNQKMNAYLKLIMMFAKIDRQVSFHTARHTFATISLNLGIPLDVVSKILGHRDLRATQVYAKLLDKTKFLQMDKWNKN